TAVATSDMTNTFVGSVVPGPNSTNTINLPTNIVLVGSILPVTGTLNDVGVNTLNLNATVPNKSQVQTYNGDPAAGAVGFTLLTKTSGAFPAATISVGQAFFLQSKAATNWTQVLQ